MLRLRSRWFYILRMAIFDTLTAATALETAGFTPKQAKAAAAQLHAAAEAGRGELAAKTDLDITKADLRAEIASVKVWTLSWTAVIGGLIVAAIKLIP